jgi:hypothetical protein
VATARTTASCREAEMRVLFVLLLVVVTLGLAYIITLGVLHR